MWDSFNIIAAIRAIKDFSLRIIIMTNLYQSHFVPIKLGNKLKVEVCDATEVD